MTDPTIFREQEVSQLFQWIRVGESASVVGVSNVGKSYLFQHLLDPQVQAAFLTGETGRYIFLRINLHNLPDFTNRSVYSLILDQMEMAGSLGDRSSLSKEVIQAVGAHHEALLQAGDDELKIQRYFKLAVRACLEDQEARLVLLFDQFDQLYKKGQDSLFYNLRGLRDSYQERILYLVFTRHALPDLPADSSRRGKQTGGQTTGRSPAEAQEPKSSMQAREELYELLQPNQLYLRPHSAPDAERLLRNIAAQNRRPFDPTLSQRLYALAGGHAGLLRNCYLYALKHGADLLLQENNLARILAVQMVAEECEKIWLSLDEDERTALAAQARNLSTGYVDRAAEDRLKDKGLLSEAAPGQDCIFSPLFAQYIAGQKTRLDRPFYVDEKSHTIYVFFKPCDDLSKAEYGLFKTLYDHENSLVSADELYAICWPEEKYDRMRSPQALTAMVSRIRHKLGIGDNTWLLQAKPGQGYILRNRLKKEAE